MKKLSSLDRLTCRSLSAGGALMALGLTGSLLAADTPAEPRTYALFQGATMALEQEGKLRPVVDVAGEAFVVWVDGKEVEIPSNGPSKMKVAPAMKLTEAVAEISAFKSERAYTPANDPELALQRSLIRAAQLNAASMAMANQVNADFKTGTAAASVAAGAAASEPALAAIQAGSPTAAQSAQMQSMRITSAPGSSLQLNRGDVEAGPGYDAIKVDFELTAPRLLGRPFILVTAQYRAPGVAEGSYANWVYARALKPIGGKPLKVHVEQGGFPPGFEFKDLQIHLYDNGQEVATNLSEKLTRLTPSEAHAQVVANYLSRHKEATLAPRPALGHLPADFPAKVQSGQLAGSVYLKVSAEGRVEGCYTDAACQTKVADPYVTALASEILFFPALAAGQPVAGVASLDLSKLAF